MSKKLSSDNWSKAVGAPDAWDRKNIEALVKTFEATTFDVPTTDEKDGPTIKLTGKQWIHTTVQEARQRHQLDDPSNDYGIKSKQMQMRILTSVPRPLYMKLLQGYPTLFKDYNQHVWFAKNFHQFRLPRKI